MSRRRDTRRRTVAVAGALCIHAALLLLLARPVVLRLAPESPGPATVELQLVASLRAVPTGATPPRPAREPHVETRSPLAAPPARLPSAPLTAPFASAEPGRAPSPLAAPVRPGGGTLPAAEMAPDLRGAVRAIIGCGHQDYLVLTSAEKARCDSRIAEAVRDAPAIDPISPDRRIHLDDAAAYAARKRAALQGPLGQPVIACPPDEPGSNLGASCLPPEAIHHTNFR